MKNYIVLDFFMCFLNLNGKQWMILPQVDEGRSIKTYYEVFSLFLCHKNFSVEIKIYVRHSAFIVLAFYAKRVPGDLLLIYAVLVSEFTTGQILCFGFYL